MFAASKSGKVAAAAATTDPNFKYVPLLLETTSTNGQQNNTFLDSSTNAFTITRNGTPTQGSVTPYWPNGYWSNYFNGSTDYLSTPSNAAFTLGTGDFTIEAWIYPTSNSAIQGVIGLADAGSLGSFGFFYNLGAGPSIVAGKIGFSNVGGTLVISTGTVSANTWTHVAFSRASGSLKIFFNGVLDSTTAFADNSTKTVCTIGRPYSTLNQDYFPGYVSNARIVKGTAVYTSAFTPSTTPLTAITNTSLLTCQSNRFIDNSTNNFTITANGTPRVQAFQPFSPTASYTTALYGGSGYFNGSSYLSIASSTNLFFGTKDYTFECWIYMTTVSGAYQTIFGASTTGGPVFNTVSGTSIALNPYGSGPTVSQSFTFVANTWYHIAFTRASNVSRVYVNGNQLGSNVTDATNYTQTAMNVASVGAEQYFPGYISNLRVLLNTALYTGSTFTPPTTPVTAITNTSLLLNMANAGIYDAAAQNVITTFGDAQVSTTQSKWSPTSMKFDGTGDWLTAIDNPQLQLGTGDFTIDGWVYLSATGVAYGIISKGAAATGWSVNVTSGNKLQFSYTASNLTGATSLAATTWYYFAVVRSGSATGNLKVYLNGTADATSGGAVTDNFNQTDILYVGASRVGATPLNGYLQDVRITKAARTITTPTAAFPTR
jgi:hypothetical protein